MKVIMNLALGVICLGPAACSSIIQGTDQDIAINTSPPGATCHLEREGMNIGTVLTTPGSVNVSKTKHDITVKCEKDGYQTATFINDSGWESGSGAAGIAVDVILTAGLSSAIDSATGADNKYQSPVNITMVPLSQPGQPTGSGPQTADAGWNNPDWDGDWYAQAGPWQLYMRIEQGEISGRARHTKAGPHAVTGQILQDGLIAGRVKNSGGSSWGSLSGSFPSVSLVQNGQVQASFELAEKI